MGWVQNWAQTERLPRTYRGRSYGGGSGFFPVADDRFNLRAGMFEWVDFGRSTEAGSPVSWDTVVGLPVANACIEVIAGLVSSLPCRVLDEHGAEIQHRLVGNRGMANAEQSWRAFVHGLLEDALLWGDGVAFVERNGGGTPVGLHHLSRRCAEIDLRFERTALGMVTDRYYDVHWQDEGTQMTLPGEQVMTVRGESFDGVRSYGVVEKFREELGLAISSERFASRLFGNGFMGMTAVILPEQVEEEVLEESADRFKARRQGINNSHDTVFLDRKAEIKQLSFAPREAQMLEARRLMIEQVAKAFGVPLGYLSNTSLAGQPTSLTERDMIGFAQTTITAWAERVRDAVRRTFPSTDIADVEFRTEAIVVPDAKTRSAAMLMARRSSAKTVNELRAEEGLEPIEDERAEDAFLPVQMVAGEGDEMGHEDRVGEAETGETEPDSSQPGRD